MLYLGFSWNSSYKLVKHCAKTYLKNCASDELSELEQILSEIWHICIIQERLAVAQTDHWRFLRRNLTYFYITIINLLTCNWNQLTFIAWSTCFTFSTLKLQILPALAHFVIWPLAKGHWRQATNYQNVSQTEWTLWSKLLSWLTKIYHVKNMFLRHFRRFERCSYHLTESDPTYNASQCEKTRSGVAWQRTPSFELRKNEQKTNLLMHFFNVFKVICSIIQQLKGCIVCCQQYLI